jgi:PPOX class probable F420-dependent enzyme
MTQTPTLSETVARRLRDESVVWLTTVNAQSSPVPTPVWSVSVDGQLWVWTAPNAGKVKRIRRNGGIRVVPCTLRGRPRGVPVPGWAELVEKQEAIRVLDALVAKYGWQARFSLLAYRFDQWRGREPKVGAIRLTVPPPG